MKILVTEDGYKSAVVKWLDHNYGDLDRKVATLISSKGRRGSFYYITKEEHPKLIFTYDPRSQIVVLKQAEMATNMLNMFGLDIRYEGKKYIEDWLRHSFGIHAGNILSPIEFIADTNQDDDDNLDESVKRSLKLDKVTADMIVRKLVGTPINFEFAGVDYELEVTDVEVIEVKGYVNEFIFSVFVTPTIPENTRDRTNFGWAAIDFLTQYLKKNVYPIFPLEPEYTHTNSYHFYDSNMSYDYET